jgi:large subunit ribosomal protein L24
MKLKKGDQIQIISGKDRGKSAKILHVYGKESLILAEGINLKKKHVRPRTQGKRGEIVQIPAPFPSSTAMIICGSCAKPTRVGFKVEAGEKVRVCKRCSRAL